MNLADMLKTDWFGRVATATLATSATHGPKTLRSVATVATVTVAIPQNLSAVNDPASPKALEPIPETSMVSSMVSNVDVSTEVNNRLVNSPVNRKTPDWKDLDRAYQTHHIACPTCIAAGKGYGLRCGTGAALWAAYDAVDMVKPQRAASVTPPAKTGIHPSLLTAATNVETDRMAARLALFDTRGMSYADAGALADRLLVRDRENERLGCCAECLHLVGDGPGRWKCDDRHVGTNDLAGANLGAAFVHLNLHRCNSLEKAR